jgi:hypothetical protein
MITFWQPLAVCGPEGKVRIIVQACGAAIGVTINDRKKL